MQDNHLEAVITEPYHLPECHYIVDTGNIQYGWNECICDELRACEQRVIAEGDEQSQIAYSTGYRHALDAAVHAVLALPTDLALSSQYTVLNRAEVFWAIWGLKDNP